MRYNAENILQQNEGEKKMAAMTRKAYKLVYDKSELWYFGYYSGSYSKTALFDAFNAIIYADCNVGNDRCVCSCGNSCLITGPDREDKE